MLSKFISTLSVLHNIASIIDAEVVGPITIMENGEAVTRYALSTYAATISTDGSSLTMEHNSGIQIASQAEENYTNPYAYVGYDLNVKSNPYQNTRLLSKPSEKKTKKTEATKNNKKTLCKTIAFLAACTLTLTAQNNI